MRQTTEAELILAHVIKKPREFILAHPEMPLSLFQKYRYKKLLRARENGVPLAYLTHTKSFYGFDFFVNKHVLIPRPETELIVESTVDQLTRVTLASFPLIVGEGMRRVILIDVGTGSGCIPVAIGKEFKIQNLKFKIFGIDISRKALRVAKQNAKKHDVDITFLHGNLLEPMLQKSEIRNQKSEIFITANLPYLATTQWQNEPSIHKEPKTALLGGGIDGLQIYKIFLKQLQRFVSVTDNGVTCFLEIDPSQTEKIPEDIQYILTVPFTLTKKKDLAGNDRVIIISFSKT